MCYDHSVFDEDIFSCQFMSKIRKNKTNLSVTWPTTPFFTIEELHRLNPKFINITLRVRLASCIEEKIIAEIGSVPGGKGRPKKVFCVTPVTKITLDRAAKEDVTLVDNAEKLINVLSFTSNQPKPFSPIPFTNPTAAVA
jgi:hypothetical protein